MELMTESDYRLLPKFLVSKRAILNPKNIDHRSFGYAICLPKILRIGGIFIKTRNGHPF